MNSTKDYLTDGNKNYSLLNLNLRENITNNDYIEVVIMDKDKYRLDLICKENYGIIGNENLYFFILWINNITTLDELNSGNKIKIPTNEFIINFYRQMKIERNL